MSKDIFSRSFHVLEYSRKNPGLSKRCGNPEGRTSIEGKNSLGH